MPYFRKNTETGDYEKSVVINGITWNLKVRSDQWSKSTSKSVSRWVSSRSKGGEPIFRWGDAIPDVSGEIVSGEMFTCGGCGRHYTSRSGLWKHEQLCIKNEAITESCIPTHTTVEAGGTQINQSIHNTININLRDYGKENPSWLTEGFLYSVIGNMDRAIPMLMKRKHFDEKFPENMNLRINTRGDINRRLQVRENGKWRLRDSRNTFYKVVCDSYDILCEALAEDMEDIDDDEIHPEIAKARRSERFITKVNRIRPLWEEFSDKIRKEGDSTVLNDLWEDLKTLLLDRKLCVEQEC